MVQTFKAPQRIPSPNASDSAQEIVFQNIEAQEDDNIELNESIEDELPSSRTIPGYQQTNTNTQVNLGSVVPNPKIVKDTHQRGDRDNLEPSMGRLEIIENDEDDEGQVMYRSESPEGREDKMEEIS